MEVKGQVAIVTGAAQGLGETIAYRLLREGAKVVFADINFNSLTLVLEKYDLAFQDRIHIAQVDVTDEQSVEHLMQTTFNTFGRIDLLVSNAGVLISGDTPSFDAEAWKKVQTWGQRIVRKRFSTIQWSRKLPRLIETALAEMQENRKRHFIGRLLRHHRHRSTEYMSRWIESKNRNTGD